MSFQKAASPFAMPSPNDPAWSKTMAAMAETCSRWWKAQDDVLDAMQAYADGWLCINILSEDIALKQKAFLLSEEIAGVWIWGR